MIKGQNIPQSSVPEVQKLDAKAYSIELQRHEAAYNHNNIHAPGSDKETVVSVGVLIGGAAEKTTPVNADMFPLMDTADSNKVRKLSWLNIKATLKAYFDTLYAASTTVTFPGFGTTGSTACVGNDSRLSDSRTPAAHNHTAANVTDFASAALSSAPAETATSIGALINAATAITAPDDTDTIVMRNHTGGLLHKMTWAYVKSVLKTYFDGIYAAIAQTMFIGTTSVAINRGSSALTLAGITLTTPNIGVAAATSITVGSVKQVWQKAGNTITDNSQYTTDYIQSQGSIRIDDATVSFIPFYFLGFNGSARQWSFLTSAGWQIATAGTFTHIVYGGNTYSFLFESSTGMLWVTRTSGSINYKITILFTS